jgi:transcriptional regulator with XRE-family HTH domain
MLKSSPRRPSPDILSTLSTNIIRLRKAKALSQEELADMCGIHRTYIGSVERQERNLTLSSLEMIAAGLEVSVLQLLTPAADYE